MKVRAIIETGKNLDYDIYTDDNSLGFMLLGQGNTIEEAKSAFLKSKEEMKAVYEEAGESFDFDSLEFEYVFDTISFLKYSPFTLTGLSKATGINCKQLSHYVTGYRKPSPKTIQRIQTGVTKFAETMSHAVLV
ncbi:MAG: helix-turn-helix transcriptional regulator [Bacteroidales bacterium]|nr:helix-turn-helix transcriptional regulator [Bacteroidales bacterium]